jgi:hypothetical protein
MVIVVNFDGNYLALSASMRDRSALLIVIVIAGVIFALQLFVKENLFSSTNIEAAGKLHQIFKAGDILPLLNLSQNTAKPQSAPWAKMNMSSAMVVQHKELSECPYSVIQSAEHNRAITHKCRSRARKS